MTFHPVSCANACLDPRSALCNSTNQQRVLTALRQASEPLSAYALLDRLREHGFSAPMQVYRALERLANDGVGTPPCDLEDAYVPCNHHDGRQHGLVTTPSAISAAMWMSFLSATWDVASTVGRRTKPSRCVVRPSNCMANAQIAQGRSDITGRLP